MVQSYYTRAPAPVSQGQQMQSHFFPAVYFAVPLLWTKKQKNAVSSYAIPLFECNIFCRPTPDRQHISVQAHSA